MTRGPRCSPLRRRLGSATIGAVLVGLGCAQATGTRHPAVAGPTVGSPLAFVAGTVLGPLTRFEDTRIGGLSGLAYDVERQELLALSDAGRDSRFYVFDLTIGDASVTVEPRAVVRLRGPDGRPLETDLDPEGMALTSCGHILVASEGGRDIQREVSPAIYEFTRDGRLVGALPVPEKFRLYADATEPRGVRFNRAFESLSLAPSESRLFTATEAALLQDTPANDPTDATRGRILEYERRGQGFEPMREWSYRLDPPTVPDDFVSSVGENGLVDLLALSDTELLALERSFVIETGADPGRRHQQIRLYRISTDEATNVIELRSLLDPGAPAPLAKTLVLDFGTDTPRPPDHIVDNYEGLAFGPMLADGSRTIILASDDNFSDRQQTAILVFRIEHEP